MNCPVVWNADLTDRTAEEAAAFTTLIPGDANGSIQARPTVTAAATATTTSAAMSQIPGRLADGFHSTAEPPDDENITPARVRSVPHDAQYSADECTGDPHMGQG